MSQTITKSRYIWLPVDAQTKQIIDTVRANNPYFSDLDAIKYIVGKYIVTQQRHRQNKTG